MMVDTLLEKAPPWLDGDAPDADAVVWSQCSVGRNLSDFPFPARCSEEEKRSVERRVLDVLESLNLLSTGRYYALPSLDPEELRFLAERRLITYKLMCASGPRGVYVSNDQSLCIMVNGLDHLCLRAMFSGQQLQEAWSRLTLMDDTLSSMLDFAYDERLGYLAAALENLGTGLKASILLHLPALAQNGEIKTQVERAARVRLVLRGVRAGAGGSGETAAGTGALERDAGQSLYSDMKGALHCAVHETRGDLYLLVNRGALGCSEDEILFQLRQTGKEILEAERAARTALVDEAHPALGDRVGRAYGVAGGARLISFTEGLGLLSSIRLGVALDWLPKHRIGDINDLLLRSQGAHLEMAHGGPCDELDLSMERSELFRARFS